MTDYEAAMTESGWSGCCPNGWSWMLESGAGEPVLCWHWRHPDGPASRDYVQRYPAAATVGSELEFVPARVMLDDAMQAGNLWQRCVEGAEPTVGPA